jgi:hypothetical protein
MPGRPEARLFSNLYDCIPEQFKFQKSEIEN